MSVMKTSLTIIPMCPRERFSLYKCLSKLVLCYKKDWAILLHFIYFYYLLPLQITLSQNYLLPIISVLAENTLLKTEYHFLLLLVGFDTLTYRKVYNCSHILVGHQVSIKTKYKHRSIMHIIITSRNFNIKLYQITFMTWILSYNFSWTSNNSSQHWSIKHKPHRKPTNYALSQLCNYNSSYFQVGSRIRAFRKVHILNHHLIFYDC